MSDVTAFVCQLCRARLNIVGNVETDGSRGGPASSVFDPSRAVMDESFIVLDDKRGAAGNPSARGLEESFVVLGSASLLRPGPGHGSHLPLHMQQAARGGTTSPSQQQGRSGSPVPGQQAGRPVSPQPVHYPPEGAAAFGLDAKLQALAQVFELASTQTQVDQPLCVDCAAQLKEEVEAQIQEAERDIAAYSSAVARLEAEPCIPLDAAAFEAEVQRLQQHEQGERQRARRVEADLAEARRQEAALKAAAADVDALEERYWHDYNDYQLQLQVHMDERDGLLSRIDRASQRLQLLRNTNVYNDAFKIWHDGPFGTISGFRLGRTPEVPVEWDEINAAWGQAVLLLHSMAQACAFNFTAARLLPMGSHPRVGETGKRAGTTYDLFGPANKFWSAGYDKAMIAFLACLREFGDYLRQRDGEQGKNELFEFPFVIDGDKVNSFTIKLTLSKDAKWTKALKFMLADLKFALNWMLKRELADLPQLTNLGQEGPTHSAVQGH